MKNSTDHKDLHRDDKVTKARVLNFCFYWNVSFKKDSTLKM